MNGFKLCPKKLSHAEIIRRELALRKNRELASSEMSDPEKHRYTSRLKLPDIELSKKNRASTLSNYFKISKQQTYQQQQHKSAETEKTPSNSTLDKASPVNLTQHLLNGNRFYNKKTNNQQIIEKNSPSPSTSSQENNNNDSKNNYNEVIIDTQLSKTIAGILPRHYAETNDRPNFYLSYKQSVGRIEHLENLKYSKSFKINVSAPRNWLKSKYMRNAKLENNSFMIMQYLQ